MWPFSRHKSVLRSGVLQGMTDCHSHILPGVDDGVKNINESLAILDRYEKLGIRKVWLTPHVMEDIPNKPSFLRERFEMLKAAYDGGIELNLGAENMIDSLFEERLAAGDLLTVGADGRHLLVETSYFTPPYGFYDTVEEIKRLGYYPILAHPERYVYMDQKDYERLKGMNVLFQMNLFSLVGMYGKGTQHVAQELLKRGMYDFVGTDIHSISILDMFLNASLDADCDLPIWNNSL